MVVLLTPQRVCAAVRELREKRAPSNQHDDQEAFNIAWSQAGKIQQCTPDFDDGQLLHQIILTKKLQSDLEHRMRALDAIGREQQMYFNALSVLLAVVAIPATVHLGSFVRSPVVLLLWLPALALVLLLRSHASQISSLWENEPGPGTAAAPIVTQYLFVNNLREYLLRRNNDMQRARRQLAVVYLLFTTSILAVCGSLTVIALLHLFG